MQVLFPIYAVSYELLKIRSTGGALLASSILFLCFAFKITFSDVRFFFETSIFLNQ